MRVTAALPSLLIAFTVSLASTPAQPRKHADLSTRILSAKTIYFDDRSGAPASGKKALEQLKKWGRYQIVQDRKQADLVFLFSADPYKGGYIIISGGQTATVQDDGRIEVDPIPTYNKLSPVRDAYLTVIDPRTGESLWSDSHVWGGLLTGFDTAGERLVNKLKKQVEK